jgi:hypothetical protein
VPQPEENNSLRQAVDRVVEESNVAKKSSTKGKRIRGWKKMKQKTSHVVNTDQALAVAVAEPKTPQIETVFDSVEVEPRTFTTEVSDAEIIQSAVQAATILANEDVGNVIDTTSLLDAETKSAIARAETEELVVAMALPTSPVDETSRSAETTEENSQPEETQTIDSLIDALREVATLANVTMPTAEAEPEVVPEVKEVIENIESKEEPPQATTAREDETSVVEIEAPAETGTDESAADISSQGHEEAAIVSISPGKSESAAEPVAVPHNDPKEGRRFIGYQPNQVFVQPEPWSYPYVSMPVPGSEVWAPRPLRLRLSRDAVEEMFQLEMRRTFPAFEIAGDDCIPDPAADKPHEPDISLVIKGLGLNLFIDVEIDEPFDRNTKTPKHLVGEDRERDEWFNDKGWIVIRLAEAQVKGQPKHCLAFIARVIHSVYPEYHIPSHLKKLPDPKPVAQWTFHEAEKMAGGD